VARGATLTENQFRIRLLIAYELEGLMFGI
jgi:hypothetical protein